MLLTIITIILFSSLIGAVLLFRHNGKKSIFNIDLVQFVYLFVVTPLLFVSAKTFLFYVVRNELAFSLSIGQLFAIDTLFTVIALYAMASVSIHSLTKTFWLRRRENPEFDIFRLSEYFHLWWSHITAYFGGMTLLTFISVANLFIPTQLEASRLVFLIVPVLGFIFGTVIFIGIWLSNPQQRHVNFLRIMKLLFGIFFALHSIAYLIVRPAFHVSYSIYWFVYAVFIAAGFCGIFFDRTKKADDLLDMLKHIGWGDNIEVFGFKKK